jgi:hypothetical protein
LQKSNGIYEDINQKGPTNPTPSYSHGVLNYTASATNALWAAKLLEKHKAGDKVYWGQVL